MTGAGTGARAAALGSLPAAPAQPLAAAASLAAARSTGSAEDRAAEATLYGCCFTVMPARLPYRPPHTMKPLVDGPQMAHVVGPPGEEIFCDEHGRVKVQFPWDRYGRSDDKSSCWIRVAHNWGGATWGHIALPRIGHEVIVDFLEGDPDQPIIIGRTYHAGNRPPYKLPDHKTKMVIRSDTHKGAGYNEISFEDENGQQEIFVHAQKDMNIKILNDRTKTVDANETNEIKKDCVTTVGLNNVTTVGVTQTLAVGVSRAETIGMIDNQFVGAIRSVVVGSIHSLVAIKSLFFKSRNIISSAEEKLLLQGPGGMIEINKEGIIINAKKVAIRAASVAIDGGSHTCQNSGAPLVKK